MTWVKFIPIQNHSEQDNGTTIQEWSSIHRNGHLYTGKIPEIYDSTLIYMCIHVQVTLFISKSRGPDKILQNISSLR